MQRRPPGRALDREKGGAHTQLMRIPNGAVTSALLLLAAAGLIALEGSAGAQSRDRKFQLQVERNVVQVRVVVLDSQGKPVSGLTRNDFLIYDNNKRQEISGFSTEGKVKAAAGPSPKSAAAASGAKPAASAAASATASASSVTSAIPSRFVALYYDDLWMPFSNIALTRDAARKYLESEIKPDDRVGIFTSSGQGNVDFTADHEKLTQALAKLQPRSMESPVGSECPPLTDYEAYLVNRESVPLSQPSFVGPGRGGSNEFAMPSVAPETPTALQMAAQQVIQCACHGDASHCPNPALQAKEAARMRWNSAQYQIRVSLGSLEDLVQRVALMPGRRTIVFISPGFVDQDELPELSEIVDLAVHDGVVINGIDSRGLWAQAPGGNASENARLLPVAYEAQLEQIQRNAAEQESDVISTLAEGTGGIFFHDNNDFNRGFREAGGLPPFAYVLAFSPSNLKDNGAYHHLKVKLADTAGRGLIVEARKGYYAPRKSVDAAIRAAEEVRDAVFSREESHGLPLQVETAFAKMTQHSAVITVTLHLGAKGLNFRKEHDRYVDEFTSVTGIFDGNGLYLCGTEKTVDMSLTKGQLKQAETNGFKVQLEFEVAPGNYMVRNVIRDSNGAMAAVNNVVRVAF